MRASSADAVAELRGVLTLVVPTGMTKQERQDWLKAAYIIIKDVPHDLLSRGCIAAGKVADHPSKIVKAIIDDVQEDWDRRKEEARETALLLTAREETAWKPDPGEQLMARRGMPMTDQEVDLLNARLMVLGSKVYYQTNGASYDRVTGEQVRPPWNGYVMEVPKPVLQAAYDRWGMELHRALR